jgi:predicted metal-dependent hydrolase
MFMRRNRRQYLALREQARTLVKVRIAYFNTHYRHTVGKIFIKNHKSRWGSCSEKGNLNFNYKVALLPPAVADYVVVHELCHLREFNHSERFWALVAQTIPDYKARRAQLRQIERMRAGPVHSLSAALCRASLLH